ncbi:MAG: AAA family ATPase [Candidatus Helarchaeota archaeon]
MIVQRLNIQEFRGIKECKNPIELSTFNILIGRNNSGKSTILEALSLLPGPKIHDYFTNQEKIRNLLTLHRSQPQDYKPLIYLYAGSSRIQYTIDQELLEIYITENDYRGFFQGEEVGNYLFLSKFFQVDEKKLSDSVLYIPNNTSIIELMETKMESLKELIMKKGFHVSVAESLNKCVDDIYSEIVFLKPISIRKVFPKNSVYIELKDLGSGAEKAIKIMSLLEALNPRLLLIDDFEAGFHPSLIKLVLNWLKEKKWQIVISTHSLDVLYNLIEVNPENANVIQLYKSDEDILIHKILKLEVIKDFLNANTDPRLLVDALQL